jgi:hypothetical protein
VPFITLFPAILIAALVGGLRAGILVAVLSGLAGWYWFVAPLGSYWLPWHGFLIMTAFVITAAIQLYVIKTLNLAIDQLSQERDQSAVLQWQRRTAVSDPANSAKALDIARQARVDGTHSSPSL